MKKSYVKPMIDFESFELTEFIASCDEYFGNSLHPEYQANFHMKDSCGISLFGDGFYFSGTSSYCGNKIDSDEQNVGSSICYTNQTTYQSYFRS